MGQATFTAVLGPQGPAAAFVLDDATVAAIGEGAKQFRVVIAVNGRELRLAVARRGGVSLLGFSKAARDEAGVEIGETYEITVRLDVEERTVELPAELAAALAADPAAQQAFDALAFTYRKEHARAVADAKKPETRERRIDKILAGLRGA